MLETVLARADHMAASVLAQVYTPPPSVDYLDWAKGNIRFTEATSQFPGAYDDANFPFFSEILAALSPDDPCRIVSLAKSAQVGGTILANVFTLGTLDLLPGLFLYVHPTEENGDRWSKTKLTPMIRESARLRDILPERAKEALNSVRYKERADGRGAIQIAGANSPANLSMITAWRQVHDDLSKWQDNAAGDPETQAESRAKTGLQAKIFKISTPMVSPGCRISRSYGEGTQERYHVPCPHCHTLQSLEWENMRDNIDPAQADRACFSCVSCGSDIEERHRAWMVDPANGARWIAKYPERRNWHRSFHIWTAYSPLERWSAIARGWLRVQSGAAEDADQQVSRSLEQTFLNDTLGLPIVFDQALVEWEALRDRAEENERTKGVVPARALVLILGIDVQETWVEWTLWGYGRNGYRAPIDHGTFDGRTGRAGVGQDEHSGHIAEAEIRSALDGLLARTWRDEQGIPRPVDLAAIDGNYTPEDVWNWAKKHPRSRVIMVRGGNQDYAPPLTAVRYETDARGNKKRSRPWQNRFFNFNASSFKIRLMRELRFLDPERPNYIDLPSGLGDLFYKGLVSEQRVQVKSGGRIRWRWDAMKDRRNEVLDNANQATAGAYYMGLPSWTEDKWAQREESILRIGEEAPDLETLIARAPAATAAPFVKTANKPTLAEMRRARRGEP